MNTQQANALSSALYGLVWAGVKTEMEEHRARLEQSTVDVQWSQQLRRAELRLQHVLLEMEIGRPKANEPDHVPSIIVLASITRMVDSLRAQCGPQWQFAVILENLEQLRKTRAQSVRFCDEALTTWRRHLETDEDINGGDAVDWLVDWLNRLQASRAATKGTTP